MRPTITSSHKYTNYFIITSQLMFGNQPLKVPPSAVTVATLPKRTLKEN